MRMTMTMSKTIIITIFLTILSVCAVLESCVRYEKLKNNQTQEDEDV